MAGIDPKTMEISPSGTPIIKNSGSFRSEMSESEMQAEMKRRTSGDGNNTADCSGTTNTRNCSNDNICGGSNNTARCWNLGACVTDPE